MPQKTLGILHSGKQANQQASIKYFKDELEEWMKGTAVTIVWDPAGVFYSDDNPSVLAQNAGTLAGNANLDMIIAAGGSASVYAVQAAQMAAGTTTNVVFTTFSQMQSPTQNMCGVCAHTSDQDLNRMQRLHAIVKASHYGVLENKCRLDYVATKFDAWEAGAGVTLDHKLVKNTATDTDAQVVQNIKDAFTAWRGSGITAALVCADPIFWDHRVDIKKAAKPATGTKIKTMHQWHDFVIGGHGDYCYGTPLIEPYQLAAKAAKDVLVPPGKTPAQVGVLSLPNLRPYPASLLSRIWFALSGTLRR
jgi:hypothetical protein